MAMSVARCGPSFGVAADGSAGACFVADSRASARSLSVTSSLAAQRDASEVVAVLPSPTADADVLAADARRTAVDNQAHSVHHPDYVLRASPAAGGRSLRVCGRLLHRHRPWWQCWVALLPAWLKRFVQSSAKQTLVRLTLEDAATGSRVRGRDGRTLEFTVRTDHIGEFARTIPTRDLPDGDYVVVARALPQALERASGCSNLRPTRDDAVVARIPATVRHGPQTLFVFDLDQTVVTGDTHSFRGRLALMRRHVDDMHALPGMLPLLRRCGQVGIVFVLSASPPAFWSMFQAFWQRAGVVLRGGMRLRHFWSHRHALHNPVAYKLKALLQFVLAFDAGSQVVAGGDNEECDPQVYTLAHRIFAGRFESEAALAQRLRALDVAPRDIPALLTLARQVRGQGYRMADTTILTHPGYASPRELHRLNPRITCVHNGQDIAAALARPRVGVFGRNDVRACAAALPR